MKAIKSDKKCGIYKITSPSGKIYIGQSTDIKTRINYYSRQKCKAQILLYNSIKKYGWKKHNFEIVRYCSSKQLNKLEKYYIDLFKTFNSKLGMNLRDGGGGCGSHSKTTRNKMSKSRKKMYKLGFVHPMLNKKHTLSSLKKMSKFQKGRPAKNKKPIICIEDNLRFDSISKTAKHYNLTIGCIGNYLTGRSKKLRINKTLKYIK